MKNEQDEIIEASLRLNGLDEKNLNKEYYIYFDETGNVRSFKLTKGGFNAPENNFFVLGGLASKTEISAEKIDNLWSKLEFSPSQTEFKFKSIRRGATDFSQLLKNKYFQSIVYWIYENQFLIHFWYIDNVYYSFTDIIDSLSEKNNFVSANIQKSALYRALKFKLKRTTDFLYEVGYPDIIDRKKFLNGLKILIDDYMQSDEYFERFIESDDDTLIHLVEEINNADNLKFLDDKRSPVLVDEYFMSYLISIRKFKASRLFFDHEYEVEKKLENDILGDNVKFIESDEKKAKQNNEFVDNISHKMIQISDIVVGSLGFFLTYLNQDDNDFSNELLFKMVNFDVTQQDTFLKWLEIIRRSCIDNPLLITNIGSIDLQERLDFFVDGRYKELVNKFKNF